MKTDFVAHFIELAQQYREAARHAATPADRRQQLIFAREYRRAAAKLSITPPLL